MGLFQRRFARVAARSVTAAAVSLAVLGAVPSAHASVIFDFAALANGAGGGTEGIFDNSLGYATEGGITVQASGSGFAASEAYLDSSSGGNPAGLGVCSGFDGTQCDPSSDDNVTSGETLTLKFFSDVLAMNPIDVILNPTFFRNAGHGTTFDGSINIQIDGLGFNPFTLVNNFTTALTGTMFDFQYINDEFYISSVTVTPVPLPASLPLFLSALAGLALLGRRRRKKAAA